MLLNSPAPSERALQRFLNQNPSFLPGAAGTTGLGGHHGPILDAVITQPPLPGIKQPLPDFVWIRKDTEKVVPILIEIEAPAKRWFRKDMLPRKELTQAIGQVDSWRAWFNSPANVLQFRTLYGIDSWAPNHAFIPEYVLIYGRRSEFEEDEDLRKVRASMERPALRWLTYDGLYPHPEAWSYVTVAIRRQKPIAVSFPPTFKIGPMNAPSLVRISNKEDAIHSMAGVSAARRNFLIHRTAYWDRWAKDGARGVVSTGDWE